MYKKTVTYVDYNGVSRTEDFYFNLNKVECLELEYGFNGNNSLSGSIQSLIDAKDMGTVISLLKKILLTAYGVKSQDGTRFVKSAELRDSFEQHPAFETIYWELCTDAAKSAEFVSNIIPANVRETLGPDPKAELLNRVQDFEKPSAS